MSFIVNLTKPIIRILEFFSPIADLGVRYWAAIWFFNAAKTKVVMLSGFPWVEFSPFFPFLKLGPSTLMLFEHEYKVPLLSTEVAAYLGTYVEFYFPLLLIIGLAGRFSAIVLFIFNIVAVIGYPSLSHAGFLQHVMYGTLLLVPILRGPGAISFDYFFRRKYMGND